ncbi:MAG: AtpZ/AtpI family protein [Daejeonella sp.]|uniref:AtpZ/AtpI family protein n=1 Tax=Daejeonella sp. TaxID=2805397 RepID=UPI003C760A35
MENNSQNPNIDPDQDLEAGKQALGSYAKYTGVAFQMMAIIGVSAFIGFKIDEYYDHKTQWVTALACVLGVCLSIYQTIRQLKK